MIHGTMNIAPLTVNFTDTSSGDELKFLWNFGDGQTSALRNPTHTFSQGVWNVILTVSNDNGTDTTSATIVALPPSGDSGGGNGGGGCFIAGTLIQLPSGIKSIEDIKVGDVVTSFDLKTNSIKESNVTRLTVHDDFSYMIINGIIKTTSNHPFYSDGNWTEAGNLSVGDKILHVDGLEHTIETIELSDESATVYNFEVEGTHNYFAEGYLVHNIGKTDDDTV